MSSQTRLNGHAGGRSTTGPKTVHDFRAEPTSSAHTESAEQSYAIESASSVCQLCGKRGHFSWDCPLPWRTAFRTERRRSRSRSHSPLKCRHSSARGRHSERHHSSEAAALLNAAARLTAVALLNATARVNAAARRASTASPNAVARQTAGEKPRPPVRHGVSRHAIAVSRQRGDARKTPSRQNGRNVQ